MNEFNDSDDSQEDLSGIDKTFPHLAKSHFVFIMADVIGNSLIKSYSTSNPISIVSLVLCLMISCFAQAQSSCLDENAFRRGGNFDSHHNVGGFPINADGIPDGSFTGNLSEGDQLTLSYPNLEIGDEICVTLGFNNNQGRVTFELDGETISFNNSAGITFFLPQEFCLPVTQNGTQLLKISESGSGFIRVDGSTYTTCQCGTELSAGEGSLDSHQGVASADEADGKPDGAFSGIVSQSRWQNRSRSKRL